MPTLLVGYDLREGQDYEPLVNRLKGMGTWWHHLDSTWLVRTELSAVQLRDALRPLIAVGDKLLVVDVTGRSAAWFGVTEEGSAWMKQWL